jgi:hypothetical protein
MSAAVSSTFSSKDDCRSIECDTPKRALSVLGNATAAVYLLEDSSRS